MKTAGAWVLACMQTAGAWVLACHADSQSLGASLHADSRSLGASLHADSLSLGASLHADSLSLDASLHADSRCRFISLEKDRWPLSPTLSLTIHHRDLDVLKTKIYTLFWGTRSKHSFMRIPGRGSKHLERRADYHSVVIPTPRLSRWSVSVDN